MLRRCKEILTDSLENAYTWLTLACVMVMTDQAHAGALTGLKARLDSIGTELLALGGGLTLIGFIWALLSMIVGVAGTAKAVTILAIGIAISFSRQIVDTIVTAAG